MTAHHHADDRRDQRRSAQQSAAICVLVGAIGLSAGRASVWAEEKAAKTDSPKEADLVVTTEGSMRYLSLKDWPVTRKNGIVTPVSLEEYLSMKFGQVRDSLNATTHRLEALERKFTQLEEDHTQLQAQMALLQQAEQEVTHGDTTQSPEASEGPSTESQKTDRPTE